MRYSLAGTVVDLPKRACNGFAILHELGAQLFWPHQENQKGRGTTPESMSWHLFHVMQWLQFGTWAAWKRRFVRLSDAHSKKIEARYCGTLFNKRRRQSETRKKADCFPLLKWITRLKMSIQKSDGVKFPTNGFPQMGPWQHVGAIMEIDWKGSTKWIKVIHRELNPRHAKPEKIVT